MEIKIGSDIIHLGKFKRAFAGHRSKFKEDVFFPTELEDTEISHLAGIFAAKEATIKALDLKPGQWKKIEIKHTNSGKPLVSLKPPLDQKSIKSHDVTISHHGDYALAVVVMVQE